MRKLLIKNVEYKNEIIDILIKDERIEKISKNIEEDDCEKIDVMGMKILPAFVDLHCHLRDPGEEYKEDIITGTKAGLKGGYSALCCMPNTKPVVDNKAIVSYIVNKSKDTGCKVYPIGSITKGSFGKELSEMGFMKEAGIVAVSDDGRPVESANMMRLALEYASQFNLPVISHCEDISLTDGGLVNEGYNSTICGLKGITRASEEVMVAREIVLAESLNKPVHIAHISTKGSVELIREAKKRKVQITCETCPHYFSGTDDMIVNFDTNAKVNPPLREIGDVEAIKEGLKDGTIDVIATDHAPHSLDEKNCEFALAKNGISGIETAFALSFNLVKEKVITLERMSELMTKNPAGIIHKECGKIEEGGLADLVIYSEGDKKIEVEKFVSKGKNNPFNNRKVGAEVEYTIVLGKIQYIKN